MRFAPSSRILIVDEAELIEQEKHFDDLKVLDHVLGTNGDLRAPKFLQVRSAVLSQYHLIHSVNIPPIY